MTLILACGAFPPSFVLLVFSPVILLVGLPMLLAIASDVRSARERRTIMHTADNRCLHCGYDLRATPHRCPECGTPAEQWVEAGQLMATEGAWEEYATAPAAR